MNAAPAFPGKKTVTQPDGTTIEVRMVGDERFHTLVTDTDAPARYFNLQGIEVNASTLAPGIYIRLQGGRSEKIAVR